MREVLGVIQARMGSSRLPGKVLTSIGGKNLIDRVYSRIRMSSSISEVIVATSERVADDILAEYLSKNSIPFIRGSEDDVCDRFWRAAWNRKEKHIARFCGDSPFHDPAIIDRVVEEHLANDADYTTNGWNLTRTYPLGMDIRVFKKAALETCLKLRGPNLINKENPVAYLHENLGAFKCLLVQAESQLQRPELRFIVDYPEDLQIAEIICSQIGENFSTHDLIQLADRLPSLRQLMENAKEHLKSRVSSTSTDLNHLI